jgi:hypothetical protein
MVSNLVFMMTASVNNVTTIQLFYSVFIKLILVFQSTRLSAGIWEPGSCQHCCSASKSGASLTTSSIILVYLQSACQLRLLIVSVLSLEANCQFLPDRWCQMVALMMDVIHYTTDPFGVCVSVESLSRVPTMLKSCSCARCLQVTVFWLSDLYVHVSWSYLG